MNDFDDWYYDAKENLNYTQRQPQCITAAPVLPSAQCIASDTVSFHYVSQAESLLAYRILSGAADISTIMQLRSLWPHEPTTIGHYSRKVKTDDEFDAILETLRNKIHLANAGECL